MGYEYKFDTTISSSEFAKDMAERANILDVINFLNVFANELERHHEVEEDRVIVLLTEDVFFTELAKGLRDSIDRAQEKVKQNTRKAFQQPTHEEIEKKISQLMHAGAGVHSMDVDPIEDHMLPNEMKPADEARAKHIKKTTDTLVRNTERWLEWDRSEAKKIQDEKSKLGKWCSDDSPSQKSTDDQK